MLRFLFFSLFFPKKAQRLLLDDNSSDTEFFKGMLIPLALIPSVGFIIGMIAASGSLFSAQSLIGITISAAINICLTHFWSTIVEALINVQIDEITFKKATRIECYKMTAYCSSIWFFTYSLFPIIQGGVLIGFIWMLTRVPVALKNIVGVIDKLIFKISISSILIWTAIFLFSNLFFTGFLAIIFGPTGPSN